MRHVNYYTRRNAAPSDWMYPGGHGKPTIKVHEHFFFLENPFEDWSSLPIPDLFVITTPVLHERWTLTKTFMGPEAMQIIEDIWG